jgi:hypothetical protein
VKNTSLNEITGMVATDNAIYAVQGGDSQDPNDLVLWTINPKTCATNAVGYGLNPVDPQDLAMGSDGAIWAADIGDGVSGQPNSRGWLTFEQITLNQPPATPWRVLYPSSGKFDAEAFLLDKGDTPIVIARAATNGKVAIYKPNKKIQPATPAQAQLTKVGDFTPLATGTDTPLGAVVGNLVVTGANKSPDGSKVVIRTFSDAYEFTIGADGDIVKAITNGTPVITPLPNEPSGRAITYSSDGKYFLTLSATDQPKLLQYTPYVPQPQPTDGASGGNGPADQATGGGSSWLAKLSLSQLTRIVAAVGAVGLVLAIAGIVGIRRARRRRREEEEYDDYDDYDDRPRRRRGGGGSGYGRDSGFGEGYGSGFGDSGYGQGGQNGYAGAGYGSNAYDSGGYGANGYGGSEYAQPGYGDQSTGYVQPTYGPQGYGGEYGGQQTYGGGDYGHYGGQGYANPGGQGYADPGGQQQYGDYGYGGQQGGYENDFDPLDPRRR